MKRILFLLLAAIVWGLSASVCQAESYGYGLGFMPRADFYTEGACYYNQCSYQRYYYYWDGVYVSPSVLEGSAANQQPQTQPQSTPQMAAQGGQNQNSSSTIPVSTTTINQIFNQDFGSGMTSSVKNDGTGRYTVNIPNIDGGYRSVEIRRIDKGFVGPQGEFYSEFPTVEQLKAMYGQKNTEKPAGPTK